MAQDLKVGDGVRVKTRTTAMGDMARVVEHRCGDLWDVRGEGWTSPGSSVNPGCGTYPDTALEKIDPEPKFKIGDRVRDPFGKGIVTVTATDAHPLWPVRARYASGGTGLWRESELTKVESVPFKLERGDRVVNIKTGREGEVVHDLVFDVKPPFGKPVPVKAIEEYEEHHPGTYDLIKKAAPW